MSKKYHISPKTGRPNLCKAEVMDCPVGPAFDGEVAGNLPHFETKEEARAYVETKNREKYGDFSTVKKQSQEPVKASDTRGQVYLDGDKMPQDEAAKRHNLRGFAREKLEDRAAGREHIYEDEMTPDTAAKKMQKSLDFASERGNTILMRKLSGATIMPSGVVRSDKGRYDANETVKQDVEEKHLKEQRTRVENSIKDLVQEQKPAAGSYSAEIDGTKATITVKEALNEDAENDLREKNNALYQKVSKDSNPKYTKASLAAAGFTDEELDGLKQRTAKYDVLVASTPDTGQQDTVGNTELGNGNEKAKLEQGAKNLASLIDSSRKVTGQTAAERKASLTATKDIAKDAAASADLKEGDTAFFPARKHGNGGLVSWNNAASYAKNGVEERFKDDPRLKKAQVVERKIDPKLAKEHLTENQYKMLFSKTAVGFRVTEPKAK